MKNLFIVLGFVAVYFTFSCEPPLSPLEKRWKIAQDSTSFEAYFRIALDYRDSPYFDSACFAMNEIVAKCSLPCKLEIFRMCDGTPIDSIPEPDRSFILASFSDLKNMNCWVFSDDYECVKIGSRNVFSIEIISDSVMIESQYFRNEISLLDSIRDFFFNPNEKRHLSEKREWTLKDGKTYQIPKAGFLLYPNFPASKKLSLTNWKKLFEQIDLLLDFQNEFRNKYASKIFKNSFSKLSSKDKEYVAKEFTLYVEIILDETNDWTKKTFEELMTQRKSAQQHVQ